jgi:hypothetical protein
VRYGNRKVDRKRIPLCRCLLAAGLADVDKLPDLAGVAQQKYAAPSNHETLDFFIFSATTISASTRPFNETIHLLMTAEVSNKVIVLAYRHLYRAGLRAVSYTTPNRYVLRDRLRRAFRESPTSDFEPERIANTVQFLNNAAKDRGLEHRLVKSLCRVWLTEKNQWIARARSWDVYPKKKRPQTKWATQAYDDFYWTVRMLNESMCLCIR